VWVDLENIPVSADWWAEIADGIEACNTFVFVLTPESIESVICQLELAHALESGKRIIPVLRAQVDRDLSIARLSGKKLSEIELRILNGRDLLSVAANNWTELNRHNYLLALDPANLEAVTEKLVDAHTTDLNYVREHTRLLGLARRWERRNRRAAFLLKGPELKEAVGWLAASKDSAPAPISIHREFIERSRRHAVRRFTLNSLGMVGIIGLGLGAGAFIVSNTLSTVQNRVLGGSQINVAVVDIGELTDASAGVQPGEQTEKLSAYVYQQLSNGITSDNTSDNLYVDIDRGDLPQADENAENPRLDQIKRLADEMHADVVVYGYVDLTQGGQITYVPEFYISPRLFDADDSVGLHVFGAPIPVDSLTVVEQLELEDSLLPRIQSLRHLLTGLRYIRIDRTARALEQFNIALRVPNAWPPANDSAEDPGTAIVYMWIGTAFERNYLNQVSSEGLECDSLAQKSEVEGRERSGNRVLDCALLAYSHALELDDNLIRSYIGLGNIYVDRLNYATQTVGYSPEDCENAVEVAVALYNQAISSTRALQSDIYVNPLLILKANYNIGIAYRDASEARCHLFVDPDQEFLYYVPARDHFDAVRELYPSVAEEAGADRLLASALYERARVDANLGDFSAARDATRQVIELTTVNDTTAEQEWQWVRWKAHVLNAAIYRQEALDGGAADAIKLWENCLAEATKVLDRLRQPGRYDDTETIYRAYFFAGQASEALGDLNTARTYYDAALAIGNEDFVFFADIRKRVEALSTD
jgi:tetratricopeptide (TPR) repeat protein